MSDTLTSHILKIAKRIHQDYVDKRAKEGIYEYGDWESLPDDIKDSNIRQAMNIPVKLDAIGCYIGAEGDNGEVVRDFTNDEILILSIKEHELWVEEREEKGWIFGTVKDVDAKKTPYLVPWESLPRHIQQYDIDTAMNIIPLLDSVGLRVYRTGSTRSGH